MIRFILKSALFLGIAAMLIPNETPKTGEPGEPGSGFSVFTAIMGAQAAVADLSGICERAPMACQAGSQAMAFAAERIGAGIALAYSMVGPSAPEPEAGKPVTGRDRLYVRVEKPAPARPLEAEAAAAFARGASEALATGSIRPQQPMPTMRERPAEPAVAAPDAARRAAPVSVRPREEAKPRPAPSIGASPIGVPPVGVPSDRPAADLQRGTVVAAGVSPRPGAPAPVPRGSIPERAAGLPVPSPRP